MFHLGIERRYFAGSNIAIIYIRMLLVVIHNVGVASVTLN